tara:strand:+ start:2689 stop:3219 length:531 start_codon:yes stop_codon:yes gene_type:complete
MCDTRVEQLEKVQSEARNLFAKKNADYGDAFATYGTVGILVRLGDKIHRLQSITSKGINLVEDEKLRDTLLDLHNYAAMGIMLLDSNESSESTLSGQYSESSLTNVSHSIEYNSEEYIKDIDITGTSGNKYVIKKFKTTSGKFIYKCSCPSYRYSNDDNKTCKHIKQLNNTSLDLD